MQVRVELVLGPAQGGVVASSADTLVRRIVTTFHRVQEEAEERVALAGRDAIAREAGTRRTALSQTEQESPAFRRGRKSIQYQLRIVFNLKDVFRKERR